MPKLVDARCSGNDRLFEGKKAIYTRVIRSRELHFAHSAQAVLPPTRNLKTSLAFIHAKGALTPF